MNKWTTAFPSQEGWFWFYGFPWGKSSLDRVDLFACKVIGPIKDSSGGESYIVGAQNAFIYESEALGVWKMMDPPNPPTLEELEALTDNDE